MGIINLSAEQQRALAGIESCALDKLIDQAFDQEQAPLYGLQLSSCGPYVAQQFSNFQRDLSAYRQAKSNRERDETSERARRSGYRLSAAVEQMKRRMNTKTAED